MSTNLIIADKYFYLLSKLYSPPIRINIVTDILEINYYKLVKIKNKKGENPPLKINKD